MSSPRGISAHVTITVAPANADEFLKRSRPTFDLIVAEPACLYFELFHSATQKGRFKIVENWSMSQEEFVKRDIYRLSPFCRLWEVREKGKEK
ncbi:MAG: hypothetical protein Q9211_003865 [Gyalolechia sp. 1 TL-2023]